MEVQKDSKTQTQAPMPVELATPFLDSGVAFKATRAQRQRFRSMFSVMFTTGSATILATASDMPVPVMLLFLRQHRAAPSYPALCW